MDFSKTIFWSNKTRSRGLIGLGLLLALVAAGCEGKVTKKSPVQGNSCDTPGTDTVNHIIIADCFRGSFGTVTVNLPVNSESIGITVVGSNGTYKFIDHGFFMSPLSFVSGPGGNAPISVNFINGANSPDNLINTMAPAIAFPNNGGTATLPAGNYSIPVGSTDASGNYLAYDTLQTYVHYKPVGSTPAIGTPMTLKVNLFVALGLMPGIVDAASAQADSEISGAMAKMTAQYAAAYPNISLSFTVGVVPLSYGVLTTQSELDALISSFPVAKTNDAINLFVVSSIAMPGVPTGVIGYSLGLPGPFTRQGTIVSGVLAEYQYDGNGSSLSSILSHELGHYLGLFHTTQTTTDQLGFMGNDPIADTPVCSATPLTACPDSNNLMFPIDLGLPSLVLSPMQANVLRLNPAVQ